MSAAAPPPQRWLFGPATDLLLGCGAGYLVLLVAVAGVPLPRGDLLAWAALATLFTGMPHYGATLLRVYERRSDRRRYALFAVWATLVVGAVFVWGVYDLLVGSLLLTLYLTWSPWHYTGQNYGLAVMFLRRGGVPLDAAGKRWLYASFLFSYLLAALALHGSADGTGYAPRIVGEAYSFLPMGIPQELFRIGVPIGVAAQLIALGLAARSLRGRASVTELSPAIALVATQFLWFTLPAVGLWSTGASLGARHVVFLFAWVAIGHSIQYLWVTTFYAAGSEGAGGRLRYLVKTLLAGAAIWTLPALVFSPALLGTTTYQLGLFVLVASAVNVHHFILDGAIWKLRDGRVARVLLSTPETSSAGPRRPAPGWALGALWAGGVACAAIAISSPWLHSRVWVPAVEARDWERARLAEAWLRRIGRDEPTFASREGSAHLEAGEQAQALAAYEQSLALAPTAEAWIGIANVWVQRGEVALALDALERSLEVQPIAAAWAGVGRLRESQGDAVGARDAYQAALALDPSDARAREGARRVVR